MDRTAPATHASHDELLIARLFGGDVSEAERAHALELMAECQECESLFADLGAIAEATAAISAPTRPRDFSLTEADAARLGARARRRWAVFRLGLRRSLGGSLAALGIFGVVLTGATSVLGGAASTTGAGYALGPERAAAQPQAGQVLVASGGGSSSNFGGVDIGTGAPVPMASAASAATAAPSTAALNTVPKQSPEPSAAVQVADTATSAAPAASSSAGSNDLAAASPAVAQGASGGGSGGTKRPEATGAVSSGIDARLVWLIGFGVLFAIGLALAILPVRRGRDRGVRS